MQLNDEILDAISRAVAKYGSLRSFGRVLGNEEYASTITCLRKYYQQWRMGKRRNAPVIGDARWAIFWRELKNYLDPMRYAPPEERAPSSRMDVAVDTPLGLLKRVPIFEQDDALTLPEAVICGDEPLPAGHRSVETEVTSLPSACAAFRVRGQFMEGCGIIDGSVVIVERLPVSGHVQSGAVVCVKHGGEFLVRRYYRTTDGTITLASTSAGTKEYQLKRGEKPEWLLVAIGSTRTWPSATAQLAPVHVPGNPPPASVKALCVASLAALIICTKFHLPTVTLHAKSLSVLVMLCAKLLVMIAVMPFTLALGLFFTCVYLAAASACDAARMMRFSKMLWLCIATANLLAFLVFRLGVVSLPFCALDAAFIAMNFYASVIFSIYWSPGKTANEPALPRLTMRTA